MRIVLNHISNEESNVYLRCLYVNLRKAYGKCAWFFSPSKHGASQSIRVGSIDIGQDHPTQDLIIRYHRKGVIKELSLNNLFTPNSKMLDEKLYEIASNLDVTRLTSFSISATLETINLPFSNVCTDRFSLSSDSDGKNQLSINVSAFDAQDAGVLAGQLINQICDFLSICLNTYVKASDTTVSRTMPSVEDGELYVGDLSWIDDHPVVSGKLALAEYQVQLFQDLIAGKVKAAFINACSHFNNA
ncbi:hypothetical protein, partial [Candidatus Venteria ishoeyi]|uniref:hypothetical protein n=1 Tax=Candidatus Venteria ishoeyi TaxID=1899563 RepID=UPI0015AF41F3